MIGQAVRNVPKPPGFSFEAYVKTNRIGKNENLKDGLYMVSCVFKDEMLNFSCISIY
jgi:hypothetical protein